MNKKVFVLVFCALLLCLSGCQKKGTVEGIVLDPFTDAPVVMPTVWIDNSIFGTQKASYEFKTDLQNGKFKFLDVPAGKYLIKTRRNKYALGQLHFETTAKKPNAKLTLYIYSDQVQPGLYQKSPKGPDKISNEWVLWSATCKDASAAAYFTSFKGMVENPRTHRKTSRVNKLPEPRVVDANIDVFYRHNSSVLAPVDAVTYPVMTDNVSAHSDCKGFGKADKVGLFADVNKGTKLTVNYKADGLYEVTGTLPKGKQIMRLSQDGKTIQTYYFNVK